MSDVSATHERERFKEADKAAQTFLAGAEKFRQMFIRENDRDSQSKIEAIAAEFKTFHANGRAMAEVYVSRGMEAGAEHMDKFDKESAALSARLDEFRHQQVDEANQLTAEAEKRTDFTFMLMVSCSVAATLLAVLVAWGIARSILRQLGGDPGVTTAIANQIAAGDLSANIVLKPGDTTSLMAAMKHMSATLQGLIEDMNHMSAAHDSGEIDSRVEESRFQGSFRTMAQGVNDMVFAHIALNKKALACVQAFGEGNLDAPLEAFPGKKKFINDSIEQLRGNLKRIVSEIQDITAAANRGDFSLRLDLAGKQGFPKTLSELLNQLSDTVDTVFKDSIRVTQALAQGDLSQKISRDYLGAFNEVKQAVNTTAEALAAIVGEIQHIVEQANQGEFEHKIPLAGKQGYTRTLSELLNQLTSTVDQVFRDTIDVAQALEQGNLTRKVTRSYQGAFDQVKQKPEQHRGKTRPDHCRGEYHGRNHRQRHQSGVGHGAIAVASLVRAGGQRGRNHCHH